ncbi:hypothetical protein STEG23_035778 [Scotinomys teguina]
MRANCEDAERPVWLPERCMCPVDVPDDTNNHADDLDSTNIGTGAMNVEKVEVEMQNKEETGSKDAHLRAENSSSPEDSVFTQTTWSCLGS